MDHSTRIFIPKSFSRVIFVITPVVLFTLFAFVPANHAQEAAYIDVGVGDIYVTASSPGATFMNLRVMDPLGEMIFDQSSDGSPIQWILYGISVDGYYSYEVRAGFVQMRGARDESQERGPRVRPWRQSGTVLVLGGAIVPPYEEEPDDGEASLLKGICEITKFAFSEFMDFITAPAYADIVHADDVIIDGRECVGNDCYSGISFGFDKIVLMDHDLRIFFDDTSNTSNFPLNDWRIEINDTTDGGASYFAIQDATAGVVPFRIEAGAPANSLYVDDFGWVGLGTSLPACDLHIVSGDTPSIRFEQDESQGWPSQDWDLSGHEGGFWITDVTNDRYPLDIDSDTPSYTLKLKYDGNVGFGTYSPIEAVDVYRSAAASRFQLTSVTDTENEAPQFVQRRARSGPSAVQAWDNLGAISFRGYTGSSYTGSKANVTATATENWSGSANGTELRFGTTPNGSTTKNTVMVITNDGRVTINGTTLNVPDYVFEDSYDLMPLDELQEYVKREKRLPKVAGAHEVTSEGLDLGGTQMALLEKVEELTLYTLKQHEQLKEQNEKLKKQKRELEERIERLESAIMGLASR